MTKYQDHAAAVVTKLIDAMTTDRGGEWRAPWHHDGATIWAPINATTHNPYKGGNAVDLAVTAMLAGYDAGEWATYRQWASVDAQVRKGERATRCVRWVETNKADDETHDDDTHDDDTRTRMVPVLFSVFNAAQVDGYELAAFTEPDHLDTAETTIANTGAVILYGGTRAFYRPNTDTIQLPDRERFTSTAAMYATTFHELAHRTGAKSRLDRDLSGRFGSDAYALEELTAELTAALLTAAHGIGNEARQDHATYLQHWTRVLNEDPTVLFSVASLAQQAADHITAGEPTTTHQANQELVKA